MTKYKGYCFINLLSLLLFYPFVSSGLTLNRDNSWAHCKLIIDRASSLTNSQILTSKQLSNIFPEVLDGYKKTKIILNQSGNNATAIYGNHEFEINIIDDLSNNYSTIDSFNKQYDELTLTKADNKIITSVRDGYKTITTVDPESGTTSMSFVLNRRYLFKVTAYHHQTSYRVWRFIELNKFKDLNK